MAALVNKCGQTPPPVWTCLGFRQSALISELDLPYMVKLFHIYLWWVLLRQQGLYREVWCLLAHSSYRKSDRQKKKPHCAEGGKYFIALLAKSSKEPEKSNQRGKGTFFPSTQPDFFSTQPNSWFHSVKLHQNNKRWPLTVNATIGWYLINKEPHSF